MVCATIKASDQPAHTRSLIRAFACRLNMAVKLLIEQHLEFLSLTVLPLFIGVLCLLFSHFRCGVMLPFKCFILLEWVGEVSLP